MDYFNGSTAYGSTGIKTIYLGFQPKAVEITVGQKVSTTQNFAHLSVGAGDDQFQRVTGIYQDTTGGKTVTYDDKIVTVWERVSGTLTEVLSVKIDSFTSTELKLDVLTANANYSMHIRVWG